MLLKKLVIIQILASAVFFSNTAAAAPLTFNVDGVISDSSDRPLESSSVTFTVQVKDAAETCLLYQETFPVSMTGSNGYFSLVVGKQTNGVSGGSTLDKVFSNSGATIPGQSCTYTPSLKTETRKIIVSFDEGSGSQVFSSQEIQSVPYAVAAGEANAFTGALSGDVTGTQTAAVVGKIKGLPVDTTGIADGKILKYQSGSFVVSDDLQGSGGISSFNGLTSATQTFNAIDLGNSVLAPAWVSSGSGHTLKIPMASGTSVTGGLISNSDYANFSTKITALTGDVTASGSGTVNAVIGAGKVTSSHILDGTINGADVDFTAINSATSDLVLKDSGSGKFATFTCSTPNYVLTWTAAGWACQAPATTGLPLSGGTMSGAIDMGSNNLLNVGNVTMVPGGYLLLPNTAINGTTAGQVWYDAGNIKYYDGSAVKTVNTGTSGMSNSLSTGQIWVGNVSGGAEPRSLNGDIASTSATGAVVVNKTTSGAANTILSLDGSSVGTMSGVALVNSGTVTVSASAASNTYSLKLPAAAPTGTQVMQVDASGNLTWIATPSFTMPALNAGKIWIGNASNGIAAQTMGGDATIDNAGVLTLKNTGAIGTYTKVITDAQGRVSSGLALSASDVTAALTYTPLNKAADSMSGDLGTQNINMAANTYLKLSNNATDGSVAGQVWYDAGVIKYYDGTTVKSLGVSGAGITNLNGLSGTSQSLAVGTSGNAPAFSSASTTHTLNIPMASASGTVTAGLISNSDYVSFSGKQSNALVAGSVWVGNSSGGAEARALSGDVTISNVGLVTLKNTGTVGTYFKVFTDAQGRVTSGAPLASGDVIAALGYTPADDVSGYVNGGNSFGAAATIGTNDAYSLALKTNSVDRLTITSAGKVGIGTSSPSTSFDLGSQTDAIILPKGNTAARPGTPAAGMLRFNSSNNALEYNDGTTWNSVGNALGYTPLNKAGDAMTGALALGANDITNTGNITMAANKYLTLSSNATSGSTAGQMWYDAGVIKYYDGSAVKSLGVAGAGITSLNGLTTATQTFGNGTTGASPNFSVSGSGHILNIPFANTASVTAGLISNSEYAAFNAKQSTVLGSGQVWVGNASGASEARTLSGDIASVSNVGLVTVDKTTTGVANKILSLDGTGVANVKGLDVQTGTGKVTLQTVGAFSDYVLTLPNTSGSANQVMANDGAGGLSWVTPLTSTTAYMNGGNTFAGNATLGTIDNYNLAFQTSNTTRMTISATGNVGIGTGTPGGTLDVQGGTAAASTAGASITLKAQNAGSGGAVGGSINLTPGDGTGAFPGGSVVVATTNGQSGAINATNNMTNSYTSSSASSSSPSYVLRLANSYNLNGNTALIQGSVKNSNANIQEGYTGFVSITGAANYSPDFVMGMQTGASAYTERLRVVGATGNVGIGTSSPAYSLDFNGKTDAIRLPAGTSAQQPANTAGLIRYNTSNNNVEFNNGTAWTALAAAGAGITSFNGLTATTQSFAPVGTAGNSPAFSSSGSAHTLDIPIASASGSVTAGLISNSDYVLFSGKQSNTLAAGQVWLGNASGGAQARALSGDIAAVSNVGLVTVDKTTTGVANKILSLDGTGVANVKGLDVQTGTGKVTLQTAGAFTNYVLTLPTVQGSANQVMANDGSGNLSWVTPLSSTTAFMNGGNTFVGNATLGTNDNYNLSFKTNATTRMTLTNSGNLGIGTTAPGAYKTLIQGTAGTNVLGVTDGTAIGAFYVDNTIGAATGPQVQFGTVTNHHLGFFTNNGSPTMTLSTGGNLGIGTGIPNYALDMTGRTDAIRLPSGTTAQQPGVAAGLFRYNTSNNLVEYTNGTVWNSLVDSGTTQTVTGSKTFSGATTISNGVLTNTSISLGSAANTITAGNGNIAMGLGGTSVAGGGQFYGAAYTQTGATIDFNKGNSQSTSYDCTSGSINLTNMQSGGSYTLFVTSTTTTKCTLQDGGTNIADTQFSPVNGVRSSGVPTVYKINKHGSTVYAQWSPVGTSAAVTGFVNGGNAYAGNASLGLTDAFNLNFMTNAAVRMTINSAGNVGIGTQAPSSSLDLSTKTDAIAFPKGTTATRPSTLVSGMVRYNTTNSMMEYYDGTTWYSLGKDLGFTPVNKTGDTMSGALNMSSTNITSVNMLGIGTASPAVSIDAGSKTDAIRVPNGTTAQRPTAAAGMIRFNSTSNTMEYYDGTTWMTFGISGAGILSLNGLATTSQTLANSVSGTTPAFVSTGSTHTLNIPMANTASVTAGLISKTEYDTFNSKLNGTLTSGSIFVGNASGGAVGVAMTGDATISNTGILTVNKTTTGTANSILALNGSGVATAYGVDIKGSTSGTVSLLTQASTSSYVMRLPASSPAANQIMVSDASGNLTWATNSALGYTPVNKAGDTMTGTLEVSGNIQTNQGQVYASQNLVSTGGTVDFNTGNVQIVQSPGGSTITLNNMKDGGSYTLIVTDSTSRQYTFNNCTNPHFVPANDLTTAGTQSIYTILKVTIGGATHCYISWVTGF